MSDTEEALRLTNTEKWYAKTALDRLAQTYASEKNDQHATAVKQLATRIEHHATQRRKYQAADGQKWQQRIVEAHGNPEAVKAVMLEWWTEILSIAIDPVGTLAEAVSPLIDQGIAQTVNQVLVTIEHKMKAVVSDPSLSDDPVDGPTQALEMVLTFVHDGRKQLSEGKPMWTEDPHLMQIAQEMQQQMQQQQQQGALPSP